MFILATRQIKIIFAQNIEAIRRLHSHQFSISQTSDRAGNLRGVPGGSGRVCLWAWDHQSYVEEAFCLTSFASCLI